MRNHGVTLHLSLQSERQAVPDVPVIYFVEPTEENIQRIVDDYRAGLYSYMHVNFSSGISSKLMERFASGISKVSPQPARTEISRVIDRYCSFVSLSPSMYSLNMRSTYLQLHQGSDKEVEARVEQIAQGIVSLVLTGVEQIPVIRAPPNEAAGMVAQLVNDKLASLAASDPELFSHSGFVSSDPTHAQRPLLVLVDRDMDLAPMVGHGWSYSALMADLLGMNLNRVSLENKTHDIDVSEAFWVKVAHLPFPEAATAVNEQVAEFSRVRSQVNSGDSSLSSAISALPQITEMKKTIDLHTSIATTLLNTIKQRQIDRFVELEGNFVYSSFLSLIQKDDPSLLVADKVRTAIVGLLKKSADFVPTSKLDALIAALSGGDPKSASFVDALRYVKFTSGLRNLSSSIPESRAPQVGMLGDLAEKVKSRGEGLFAAGMKNLKNMLPINDRLPVTNVVQQLADQTPSPLAESFGYWDPKLKMVKNMVRVRGSFRQVIVCVVGGGCVAEYENLNEWAAKSARSSVIYGATDWAAPEVFLKDLAQLGKQHA